MGQLKRTRAELRRRGFTLVELLIVVIILAILAAIVVPQFASSTDDAKLAALDTTLSNTRSAVDLYFAQHGAYPSAAGDGTNAAGTPAAFVSQLTLYTEASGDAATSKDATHVYGPYLRASTLPADPITNVASLVIVPAASAGTLPLTADAGDPGGWKFDNVTGQFIMNHGTYETR